eukprot:SM000021S06439  [mRNA]  locus=s21:235852:237180:- [translate_table: standard]
MGHKPPLSLYREEAIAPQVTHIQQKFVIAGRFKLMIFHKTTQKNLSIQDIPGRFVIEKDAIACKEAICLSVIDSVPMSGNLCHSIRRSRMEHCILVLRRRCCSIHLRRPCLVVFHLPACVFNVSANSLKQPVKEIYREMSSCIGNFVGVDGIDPLSQRSRVT